VTVKREWIALAATLLAAVAPASAADVKFLRLQTQESFLRGTLDGLSVDALGTLRLASHAERIAALGEPFVLSSAAHPEGWVVGTGNSGKVILVTRGGEVRELFATPEPEVFAVWVDARGAVYAGSSPNGKVYRWAGGEAEVFFDPEETYVWGIAGLSGGDLAVATGTRGRLYRVDSRGRGRVWWESGDTHVRSVAALPEGGALAGTAGKGLVVRIAADGAVRTLYDSAHPEVVAFTAAPEGVVFAAVVASEASQLPATPQQQPRREEGSERDGEGGQEAEATVVVVEDGSATRPVGSRPPGFRGARSEILRITPGGTVESVARLEYATVYSLLWAAERLWIGTGLEGQLYSLRGAELVLENDVDERQIVALVEAGDRPAFATTNAAAFYRLTVERDRQGTYTSPVLDAGQVSRFGTFRWLGQEPSGSTLSFSFRSGLSSEPDQTWSSWTSPRRGEEISLEAVPAARFFQWRVAAQSRGHQEGPSLAATQVSYRQENLAPRITRLEVMDPGEVQVPATFSPGNQIFEPAHPTRDGIFTTLRPAVEPGDGRLRTLWRHGYRTLRWQATDPNDDSLTYALSFRPEAGGQWIDVEETLEASHYSFDSTVLPDGVYRFRLEVRDRHPGAPDGLTDVRVTEPVIVDHTPPRLLSARRGGSTVVVEVEDALSPLREARYSVDGGEWHPARPQDGLLDRRRETLILEVPADASIVMLRVMDAAFNSAAYDVLEHLE
jgi:hypothetical protein